MPSPKRSPSTPKLSPALRRRLAAIRLLILDVDGTLTDGTVWLGATDDIKGFNIADGLGLVLLRLAGVELAIVTGRKSEAVARRARELGITHLFQRTGEKAQCVEILQRRLKLKKEEMASLGDDLPDLAVFNRCGVNFAVADAAPELRAAADIVTPRPGGHGAARDVAEIILKARGEWSSAVDRFKKS